MTDDRRAERRRYIRLDHIFPVEFCFMGEEGRTVSDWYQGYTQDISSGGLCITVNHIELADVKYLADKNITLALRINIPLGIEPVEATGRLSWNKTTRSEPALQYSLGVCYEKISHLGNNRILKYVRARKLFKATAVTFLILLSLGLILAGFYSASLRIENEKLLNSLSVNMTHQKALKEGSHSLKSQIEEMKFLSSQSVRKAEILQRRLDLVSSEDRRAYAIMEGSIGFLKKYKEKIDKNTADLIAKKVKVDEDVTQKEREASLLETKIREKLYHWLAVHQNLNTGFVASFQGDRDINDWGFTYDQALAAIVFTKAGDEQKAKAIFDSYSRVGKDSAGAFYNAYYTDSGDPAESIVHAGPNIWLGLAILQYSYKTRDMNYIGIAKDIARWLEGITDNEGGVRGGREFAWYSTEHNLDAYAFYNMLAELFKDEAYADRAKKVLIWLNKNAYSRISSPVIKRGKGDSTIATDTYAWSITALTPKTLVDSGMDPDAIMDFALANCCVIADYRRADGTLLKIKGFDFAKHQNLARGGVVSSEWTAQMILALKIMANYHRAAGIEDKANRYAELVSEYTSELSKMVVTSPSAVGQGDFCLPYASHEFADTGHGWRTPKGNRTGSVAATAYAILAMDDFNPLRFNKK